jgi:hypothetical protein
MNQDHSPHPIPPQFHKWDQIVCDTWQWVEQRSATFLPPPTNRYPLSTEPPTNHVLHPTDLHFLRQRLKVVRNPQVTPYQYFDDTDETIGHFAHVRAIDRYKRKVNSKRFRARELRRAGAQSQRPHAGITQVE